MNFVEVDASVLDGARRVRAAGGYLDRSRVGRLAIAGPDRLTWLQGMVSNDTRLLDRGARRLQACVLNATGHLLSDIALISVPAGHTVAAAAGFAHDALLIAELPVERLAFIAETLDRFLILEDVTLADVSSLVASISVQGPGAATLELPERRLAEKLRVDADHTGCGGFDLLCPSESIASLRSALAESGLMDIDARTAALLRIEAAIPEYGADIDENTIPLEANLGPTHISMTKGCYVGQEIIARIDSRGHTNRALAQLVVEAGPAPQPGDRITVTEAGGASRETGRITSVATASDLTGGKPIALGYVRHEHHEGVPLTVNTASGTAMLRVRRPLPRPGQQIC